MSLKVKKNLYVITMGIGHVVIDEIIGNAGCLTGKIVLNFYPHELSPLKATLS